MSATDAAIRSDISSLYDEHNRWLVDWLRQKLRGSDHAADLAQDTFVRILSTYDARRELTLREPRAYLRTVAHRLLINYVKRKSLEQAYLDVLAAMPAPCTPSPETRFLILETLHEIDAMLDGLGAKVRETFLLSQLEGLTYAQIAQRSGITERTVKRYMAQAFAHCLLLTDELAA